MAYMDQDTKKKIAAELKKVVPAGWKYSLGVRNHSTIVMTISEAPLVLIDKADAQVNPYYPEHLFSGDTLVTVQKILAALNLRGVPGENFDKSDTQTDYFNVGWYVSLNIGVWNRPFVNTAA